MTANDRKELEAIKANLRIYASIIDRVLKSEGPKAAPSARRSASKSTKGEEKTGKSGKK